MGKTLDQLNLDDRPLAPPADARDTDWYRFLQRIEELIADGRANWALDTLSGIQKTVEIRKAVTDNQRRAVENIERSAYSSRQMREAWRRRYEGR